MGLRTCGRTNRDDHGTTTNLSATAGRPEPWSRSFGQTSRFFSASSREWADLGGIEFDAGKLMAKSKGEEGCHVIIKSADPRLTKVPIYPDAGGAFGPSSEFIRFPHVFCARLTVQMQNVTDSMMLARYVR